MHIRARAHALVRTRERRATADFAFCSRCFLCVLLPLFFSTLSNPYLLSAQTRYPACPHPPHA